MLLLRTTPRLNALAAAPAPLSHTSLASCFALGALVMAGAAGCHEAAAAAYVPPVSEATLTDEQVAKANVVVEAASEKELDDTLATSGRVAFEDVKVGHIYSPVNGRVARIVMSSTVLAFLTFTLLAWGFGVEPKG